MSDKEKDKFTRKDEKIQKRMQQRYMRIWKRMMKRRPLPFWFWLQKTFGRKRKIQLYCDNHVYSFHDPVIINLGETLTKPDQANLLSFDVKLDYLHCDILEWKK